MGFASRLRRFDLRAETGSPRFPGKPSRGFASFSDPGRSIAPCPYTRRAGAAPTARKMKAPTLRITRLHSDASPPAVYASRRALPHAMPHSLPAGGLTFAGRGSNPQACDERFQPTSWFPPLQGLAWRNRAPGTGPPASPWPGNGSTPPSAESHGLPAAGPKSGRRSTSSRPRNSWRRCTRAPHTWRPPAAPSRAQPPGRRSGAPSTGPGPARPDGRPERRGAGESGTGGPPASDARPGPPSTRRWRHPGPPGVSSRPSTRCRPSGRGAATRSRS